MTEPPADPSARPGLEIRPGGARAITVADGVTSRHAFSFGSHYDPANVRFGLLLALNEETLQPGAGFAAHEHSDVEIVTWVLRGAVVHEDSLGGRAVLRPGHVGRLTAGSGVLHSETSPPDSTEQPTTFLQMWVQPDERGLAPSHAVRTVDATALRGRLVPVVSGAPGGRDDALPLAQRDATLLVARLAVGQSVRLPVAPFVHLHVSAGAVHLAGAGALVAGDAVRVVGDAVRVVGGDGGTVTGAAPPDEPAGGAGHATALAEVLVWAMGRSVGGRGLVAGGPTVR